MRFNGRFFWIGVFATAAFEAAGVSAWRAAWAGGCMVVAFALVRDA